MHNFKVTIGIETHVVLNTKSKMFSPAMNSHNQPPNTAITWMDLALPGILPTVNRAAVNKALVLANALHMQINHDEIIFDRKNYFYVDLPKGFQITQQYFPIGTNGELEITSELQANKKVLIERIHLEEDTAKQTAVNNELQMDFNRAGAPLIEIVTTPCMHSAQEAMAYLAALRRVLIFNDISDAKMEDASLRADINISINLDGAQQLGTKVEIKNLNSISNVGKAIEFEIKRQTELFLLNQPIHQETRRFNDKTNTTEFMRDKSNAIDYRYMTEPNVLWFSLSKTYVHQVLLAAPISIDKVKLQLAKYKLDAKQIDLLLDNYALCLQYLSICKKIKDAILVFNWLTVELVGYLNKHNANLEMITEQEWAQLTELLSLVSKNELNNKQAKSLLEELFVTHEPLADIIKRLGFIQIKDPEVILTIIKKHATANPELVSQYAERPERVEKFLLGMIMKDTNSQANPNLAIELVRKYLKN